MIFNYITAGLAALFFILCAVSVITEKRPPEKAAPRKFFRRIKTSLREITLLWFIIIAAALILAAYKIEKLDIIWWACAAGVFAAGLLLLNAFRIFGRRRVNRRKRKNAPVYWSGIVKNVGEPSEAGLLRELPELLPATTETKG